MQPLVVMRRLLAVWLLLSLLGYSSSWAMDMHDQGQDGHDQSSQQSSVSMPGADGAHSLASIAESGLIPDSPPETPSDLVASCDHCCHGGAHLIGLSFSGSPSFEGRAGSADRLPRVCFSSQTISPDLRPPIA